MIAILLSAVVMTGGQAQQQPCGVDRSRVVTDSGIGSLRLGMPFARVRQLCTVVRDTIIDNWDYAEPEHALYVLFGRDTLVVVGDKDPRHGVSSQDNIRAIYISSPRLRTSDNIGVGTTAGALGRIRGATAGIGESSVRVTIPTHCGISLVLSGLGPDAGNREMGDQLTAHDLRVLGHGEDVTRIDIDGLACKRPR